MNDVSQEEDIKLSLDTGVLTILFNRPQARNALTPAMLATLVETLEDARENPDVRLIVLTGAGGNFCAGGDVKAMSKASGSLSEEKRRTDLLDRARVISLLQSLPKPTIALVEGAAAGAGLALALACDFRLASQSARFVTGYAKIGLSGDFGVSYFLTQLVGQAKALEMLMFSQPVIGEKARAMGLVHRTFEEKQFHAKAADWIKPLAVGPTRSFAAMKRNLQAAARAPLEDVLALEASNQAACAQTDDHKAAIAAFISKSQPVFSGK